MKKKDPSSPTDTGIQTAPAAPATPSQTTPYSYTSFLLTALIIVLLMIISHTFFFRVDLTTEKRYTLSPVTKETMKQLPDMVFVKIYLEGDLPLEFLKMQTRIREMLDEFRVYAGENLQYQFVNPSESTDEKVRNKLYAELYDKGLRVTNLQDKDEEGGLIEKIIFPGALISYKNTEIALNLLENNPGLSPEENLNNSEQLLEYNFISTIRTITSDSTMSVAFIEGHGELDEYQTADITKELSRFFQVDRGMINGKAGILDRYHAVIIAKPVLPFSEADKFVLDQYIMQGGRVLWFLDPVMVSMDSLIGGTTLAFIGSTNLEDQLFRYGVRLNPNLLEDIQCALIPVNTAPAGEQSRFTPAPWLYYPLLTPAASHPSTRNINMVRSEFASSIDTLSNGMNTRKTVLLRSSQYTRLVNAPVMISLDQLRQRPPRKEFNKSYEAVAVLMEGVFESVFRNRMLSNLGVTGSFEFMEKSKPASMLVVADGDIIRNDVRESARGPLISPVGLDRYSNQVFGNRDFIVNTLNYMTDGSGLINLRSKEFKLRLLDKERIRKERLKWQLINTALPVISIVLAGLLMAFVQHRRYARSKS
ncbi:MAG: gliding motility-associated ABC transporter substrate-binding protein GldG [Bacteroidales bacterium]